MQAEWWQNSMESFQSLPWIFIQPYLVKSYMGIYHTSNSREPMGKPCSCIQFIKSRTASHARIRISTTSHARIRISTTSHMRIRTGNASHARCVWTCNEIEGSYDKIIIIIVPSYTGKNITRLLPLNLLSPFSASSSPSRFIESVDTLQRFPDLIACCKLAICGHGMYFMAKPLSTGAWCLFFLYWVYAAGSKGSIV